MHHTLPIKGSNEQDMIVAVEFAGPLAGVMYEGKLPPVEKARPARKFTLSTHGGGPQ